MKKRVIAGILILLLLLIPTVSGVFASPEPDQAAETVAPESEQRGNPEDSDPETTEAVTEPEDPTEPEPSTEPSEPESSEPEPTEPEPTEPVELVFTEFVTDLEPTDGAPGREESHSNTDPVVIRYRYYWVATFHISEESVLKQKVYIQAPDGTDVFTAERTTETRAYLSEPEKPERGDGVFGGWYTDPGCADGWEYRFDGNPITDHIELYAKWTYREGTLRIRRVTDADENQSFQYVIKGSDGSQTRVVIPSDAEEITVSGLKYDVTYTVSEDSAWSWRYRSQSKTVRLTEADPHAELTFDSVKAKSNWINVLIEKINTVRKG